MGGVLTFVQGIDGSLVVQPVPCGVDACGSAQRYGFLAQRFREQVDKPLVRQEFECRPEVAVAHQRTRLVDAAASRDDAGPNLADLLGARHHHAASVALPAVYVTQPFDATLDCRQHQGGTHRLGAAGEIRDDVIRPEGPRP